MRVRIRFMIMMITVMKNRLNVKDTVLANAVNSFIIYHFITISVLQFNDE